MRAKGTAFTTALVLSRTEIAPVRSTLRIRLRFKPSDTADRPLGRPLGTVSLS